MRYAALEAGLIGDAQYKGVSWVSAMMQMAIV